MFVNHTGIMLYAIMSFDVDDSLAQRQSVREQHLDRLETLQSEGRLVLAGPCPAIDAENPGEAGMDGSLIVADFESLADARAWADDDPYVAAGVYRETIVKPFKQVFPQ